METKFKPFLDRPHPTGLGGVQKVYKFDNGYGASVIRNQFSYGGPEGKWELGVLEFEGENWYLTYDTPITTDVIGYLSWAEVEELLEKIASL